MCATIRRWAYVHTAEDAADVCVRLNVFHPAVIKASDCTNTCVLLFVRVERSDWDRRDRGERREAV